jgi:hypothetical protein
MIVDCFIGLAIKFGNVLLVAPAGRPNQGWF